MLSKKAKYAIKALLHLAKDPGNPPRPVVQIAEAELIPHKFLEAIMLELKRAGIVNSRKGPHGGYFLKKEPQEINLADIVRLLDGAIALLPCVTYRFYERCEECKEETTCGIRDVFLQVRNQTVMLLKGATLASILEREAFLQLSPLQHTPDDL